MKIVTYPFASAAVRTKKKSTVTSLHKHCHILILSFTKLFYNFYIQSLSRKQRLGKITAECIRRACVPCDDRERLNALRLGRGKARETRRKTREILQPELREGSEDVVGKFLSFYCIGISSTFFFKLLILLCVSGGR